MQSQRHLAAVLISAIALVGCVSSGKYDAALADARRANDAASVCDRDRASTFAALTDARQKLDAQQALAGELRKELERKGTDVEALLAEKGALATAIEESRARLEQLRRAQAASEARARLYRDLAMKLKSMVDAGTVKISLRDGRMVISLPNDVLFDSGRIEIKPEGRAGLVQLAAALRTIQHRRFQVAGHTDNVPIHTVRFPSNWELSTSRGVEVVKVLIGEGIPVEALSAAGYGEFDPVAPNTIPDGRARNRRIEITLLPNIDELVSVPE